MYAVIEVGGRQHKVTGGDVIRYSREETAELSAENSLTFDRVLLVGGEGSPRVGAPLVAGATVTGELVRVFKGPKIDIVKYKRRKGYHKKTGHRQPLVEVKITGINV